MMSPVGSSARAPGRQSHRTLHIERGEQVETCRALRLIGGKRQSGPVSEAHDAHLHACVRLGRRSSVSFGRRRAAPEMLGRTLHETPRDLVLAHRRPVLDAVGGDEMHGIAVAAEHAACRRDVVGDDPVGALRLALLRRFARDVARLCGKADDRASAAARAPCRRSPGCRRSRRDRGSACRPIS